VLVNETDSPCVKEGGSGVEHSIAGDSSNAQTGTVGRKKEQKRETDPSVATSNTSESTGTFRYDRLFKFSSKKMNGDSGGSNVEEGGAQKSGMSLSTAKEASGTANTTRKDSSLGYNELFSFKEKGHVSGYSDTASSAKDAQKEGVHPPAETELATDTGATSRYTEDDFFQIDSILSGKRKCTVQDTSDLGESNDVNNDVNNDVKTKQRNENVSSPKDKEPTFCHSKTADSFRYDRLFTFSKKINSVHSGGVDVNDDLDSNSSVHNGTKKGAGYHPTDKQSATTRGTVKETEEKGSFRYDRLFNFSTRKQNAPEMTDNGARTNKTREEDFFRYDRLFNFSRRKQNAPENTDNRARTNKAEEKDFFRYDRLFSFSAGKQNFTDNTDEASISSDDSYQYELELESERLDDDYAPFHEFYGGTLFILIGF
jgi:hypothetical protein